MKIKNIISSFLIFALAACANPQTGQGGITKKQVGTVAGAIGGAFAGANLGKGKGNVLGIAAGTMLGAYIGGEIGSSLDKADIAYHRNTAQTALEKTPTNTTSEWSNPDNGHSGAITPTKTYQTADGAFCREYTQTVSIGGKTEDAFGTACRQPDGSWKIKE